MLTSNRRKPRNAKDEKMPASKLATAADAAFLITRVFDAPLTLAWRAWSEADQLRAWWGPKGCTIEMANLEFRPGGFFHYSMRFANGTEWWGRFLYREIAPRERIVWLNSFSNAGCGITRAPFGMAIPLEILNEVTFTQRAGKTMVNLRATPHGATEEEIATLKDMHAGLENGYGATFDQLAEVLARSLAESPAKSSAQSPARTAAKA
jgi:uncharacterized protein YndB with AHSA1/START domain